MTESQYEEQQDEFILFVGMVEEEMASRTGKFKAKLDISGTEVVFKLNIGSKASIISHKLFGSLFNAPVLKPIPVRLAGFGNGKVEPLGCVELMCTNRNRLQCAVQFFVTNEFNIPLLGECTLDKRSLVASVDVCKRVSDQKLPDKYSDIFSGLDKYEKSMT